MSRVDLTVIILLSILTAAGCKSRKVDADDTVIVEEKVLSAPDTLPVVALEPPYTSGHEEPVCNERYIGKFEDRNDGSTLLIGRAENGYNVMIALSRLTEIDDGAGKLKDGLLVFTATDASGNPISGTITVNEDTAKLVFTDSTWEYLPAGTTYTFERAMN